MNETNSVITYYSGTSGLQLPFPKYKFPPGDESSSRLTYYSSLYNSIEVNSSFYKLPLGRTMSKWADEVPGNFRFTFKLWREITHAKNLNFKESDIKRFIDSINQVGNKKGCLLIQFPPSLKSGHVDQLLELLRSLREMDSQDWAVALEFRDTSWYKDEIYDQLEPHNVSVVMHDKTGSSTPAINSLSDFVYLRFHGPSGDYRGSYTDYFLSEYAQYITKWLGEGKTVFVYFNNTVGQAIQNLNTLNRYV